MPNTGDGNHPLRSVWLRRSRVRGNGRTSVLYKTPLPGASDTADVTLFNDWFFDSGVVSNTLTVNPATVAITGQSVGLRASRMVSVQPGTLAISGVSVGLRAQRVLTINPAVVALSGQSVTLTYTPNTAAYSITVSPAIVSITGQSVNLNYAPVVAPQPQFFSYGGPPQHEIERRKREAEEHLAKTQEEEQKAAAVEAEAARVLDVARQARENGRRAATEASWNRAEAAASAAVLRHEQASRRLAAAEARYGALVGELAEAQRQAAEDEDIEVLLLLAA